MKLILDHAKLDLLPIGEGSTTAGAMLAVADLDGSGIIVHAPLELDAVAAIGQGMVDFVARVKREAGGLEVVRELPAGLKGNGNGAA